MKRYITFVSTLAISAILLQPTAFAKPDTTRVQATNNRSGRQVVIPAHAVEVAPDVFSLGGSDTGGGRIVEGFMFVHRENVKPDKPGKPGNGGGGGDKDPAADCYSHLARGAKWKTAENWLLNPANSSGLSGTDLLNITSGAFGEWETEAGADIVGAGLLTSDVLVADEVSPDGLNETYFGDIAEPGVIAVAITWGYFGGPPKDRELIEMDQVYDEVDFAWSSTGEAGKMDYENIAQHEIGHSVGMGHTSTSADCLEQTMYPTASNGETSKRDLGVGDIAGIRALY